MSDSQGVPGASTADAREESTLQDTRILVLTHHYRAFTKGQVEAIAKHVGEVKVLVRHNPIAELYEYLPLERLRSYRKESLLRTEGLPENVTVETSSVVWLPIDWSRDRLGDRHFQKVVETIEANDVEFDLVHAHFTWSAGYVGARLKREYDIPLVLTVHENGDYLQDEYESDDQQVYDTWEAADVIIRVNERDAPLLREFNDDVRSIPNGFSRDRLPLMDSGEARARLGLEETVPVVFSLGGLSERKGFDYLVEAMDEVLTSYGEVQCYVGGDGSYRPTLERMVSERGLEDHVTFLGYVPDEELGQWMNACSLFVLPSLAEGNPTVMFEALGCGKPFIGTDVGGVSEIIDSERYGLVCRPGDSDALAAAIVEGLERSWDRETILDYGEEFSWPRIADQITATYRDCLSTE